VPAPDLDELAADLVAGDSFLGDLAPDEGAVARLDAGDRALVLRMVVALPTSRLTVGTIW